MKRASPFFLPVFTVLTMFPLSSLARPQTNLQPTFESASVRPAAPDAPNEGTAFMIGLDKRIPPRGLLRLTGTLPIYIMFAYNVEDEVEARAMRARLPDWAQKSKFTVVARAPQDEPTIEQLRSMMRGLLEERFALKAHRDHHTGTVNALTVLKPDATGPGLHPHDPAQTCVQRISNGPQSSPEPGKPAPVYCGLDLRQSEGLVHVNMIDVTLPEACTLLGGLAGVLGGRSMDQVTDITGLQGKWDITLDFLPERQEDNRDAAAIRDISGPSFTGALEKQLGLRLKKSTGDVEDLIVDHIARPTED